MKEQKKKKEFTVRSYRASDREQVRRICCETGFLGKPIDPVFEDRELFADYLMKYYTDHEPESFVVFEEEGEIKGYVAGCRFYDRQKAFDRRRFVPMVFKLIWRFLFCYRLSSKKYVWWIMSKGWREIPLTPKNMAHFHINFLPETRHLSNSRVLINYFLKKLVEAGETKVYGQMVTFEERRGAKMFARYGFEVVDSIEVTKYKEVVDTPIYLFTIVKDLTENQTVDGKR